MRTTRLARRRTFGERVRAFGVAPRRAARLAMGPAPGGTRCDPDVCPTEGAGGARSGPAATGLAAVTGTAAVATGPVAAPGMTGGSCGSVIASGWCGRSLGAGSSAGMWAGPTGAMTGIFDESAGVARPGGSGDTMHEHTGWPLLRRGQPSGPTSDVVRARAVTSALPTDTVTIASDPTVSKATSRAPFCSASVSAALRPSAAPASAAASAAVWALARSSAAAPRRATPSNTSVTRAIATTISGVT